MKHNKAEQEPTQSNQQGNNAQNLARLGVFSVQKMNYLVFNLPYGPKIPPKPILGSSFRLPMLDDNDADNTMANFSICFSE